MVHTQGGICQGVHTQGGICQVYIPGYTSPCTLLGIPHPVHLPWYSTGYTDTRVLSAAGRSPGLSPEINNVNEAHRGLLDLKSVNVSVRTVRRLLSSSRTLKMKDWIARGTPPLNPLCNAGVAQSGVLHSGHPIVSLFGN